MRDYFKIKGLKQPEIAAYIEEVLRRTEGINQATINPLSSLLLVDYDKKVLRREDILACVDQLGFPVAFEREDYSVPPSAVPALVQRMATLRRREERQGQTWEDKGHLTELESLALDLAPKENQVEKLGQSLEQDPDQGADPLLAPDQGQAPDPSLASGQVLTLDEEHEPWEGETDQKPKVELLKEYLQDRTDVSTLEDATLKELDHVSSALPGLPSSASSQPSLDKQVQNDQFSFDLASNFALSSDLFGSSIASNSFAPSSTASSSTPPSSNSPISAARRLFTYGRNLYHTQLREKTILACILTICLGLFTYSPLLSPRLFSFWLEPANIPLFAWIQAIFFIPILLTNQDLFRKCWHLAKHGHSCGENLIAMAVALTTIHASWVSFELTRLSLSQDHTLLARYPLGANFLLPALALTAYRLGEWARLRKRRRHRQDLEALAKASPIQGRLDQAFQDLLLRSDRIAERISIFVLLLALLIGLLSLAINKNLELTVWITYTILMLGAPWAYQEYFWQSWQKCSKLAGQLGLYFRSPAGMEALGRSEALIFDDAGPLNRGTFTVQGIHPNPEFGFAKEDLLELAASLSSYESDDLDEAILAAAKAQEIQPFQPIYAEVIPNLGKHVIICGNSYYAGNLDLLDRFHLASELAEKEARTIAEAGNIPLLYFNEDNYLGSIALQDEYVAHAPSLVHALEEAHVKSFYLYRHHPATVPAVSEHLGLPPDQVHADLDLPAKLVQVKAIQQKEGPSSLVLGEGSFLPLVTAHDQVVMALPEETLKQVAWEDPQLDHVNLLLAPDHLPQLVKAFTLIRAKQKADRAFIFLTIFYHIGSFAWAAVLTFIFFDLPLHPYLAPFLALGMNLLALVLANQSLLPAENSEIQIQEQENREKDSLDKVGPDKDGPDTAGSEKVSLEIASSEKDRPEKESQNKASREGDLAAKKDCPVDEDLPVDKDFSAEKDLPAEKKLASEKDSSGKKDLAQLTALKDEVQIDASKDEVQKESSKELPKEAPKESPKDPSTENQKEEAKDPSSKIKGKGESSTKAKKHK